MEEINNNDAALESLFALSRDAVLGVRSGAVVFGNEAAERLFGRPVAGLSAAELLPEFAQLRAEESSVTSAVVDGAVYTVTAVPREGAVVLTLMAPEQDLSGISAALLSRLRVAAFHMRIALDALACGAEENDAVRRAFRGYYDMLHRIAQLSDAGALARGELPFLPKPMELGEMVSQLIESVAFFTSDRGTAVYCEPMEGLFPVSGDRDRLEELILILLSNALLHTGPDSYIRVRLQRDGERAVLSVDDNGTGMSARELSYAFALRGDAEPADAVNGAGMGLYIAQGIARLHGGAIVLRSEPGKGTLVRVALPLDENPCIREIPPSLPLGPERILTELSNLLPPEMFDEKFRD